MTKYVTGLVLVLGTMALGCSPAPTEKTAQTKPSTGKSVDEGFLMNGGNVLRCSTPDGGFTTICRTP